MNSDICNVTVFLFILFQLNCCKALAPAPGGYLELSMTNGEPMTGDSSFADFSKMRLKKVNRTHLLIGEAEFFQELTNEIKCKILLYKKQGGEYRLTQFKVPVKGFCDFYNTEQLVVPDLQNSCPECPKQEEKLCPWKAQKYNLDGFKLSPKNIPPYFEGDYLGQVQFLRKEEILAGYNLFVSVIR